MGIVSKETDAASVGNQTNGLSKAYHRKAKRRC